MFGYIMVNKAELKVREMETYQSYYCGLCRELKDEYGTTGRIGLSYDMNFLVLLLTGLYEPDNLTEKHKCMLHPFGKKMMVRNKFTGYAADMNILLTYYKCQDDWKDDRKYGRLIYGKALEKKMARLKERYRDKIALIESYFSELEAREAAEEQDVDRMAGLFGRILGNVFAYQKDAWEDELYQIGYYLGGFVYLCDAYEDLEKDISRGRYNPYIPLCQKEDFEETCSDRMTASMAACCKMFEKLPVLENVGILRNILYSGVWCRYENVRKKRAGREGDVR